MQNIIIILNIFIFLFGLCIGSFLNCVIYRLEQKKSLKGRSFCPCCKHPLSWRELFPVFSFLFLRGKCRYCRKKISWQYPLVEIFTGILFVLIFWSSGFGNWDFIKFFFIFYISSAMIVIFVYDLKHYIIPDKILFPAVIIAFVYQLFLNLYNSNWILNSNFKLEPLRCNSAELSQISNFVIAALVASGFFFIIWLVSGGRWMGFGDVKLAVLMGFLLGLPNVLAALFLAFFFGAIIGLIMMIFGKKSLKSEIPFGPFLITGTVVALLWGGQIIQWYLHMFIW